MKARKAMALAMTAAMVGGLMTVPVMAEENAELLPGDRKSTRLNSSHASKSRMPSSA